ncbi:oligosaccharide flippase family protein [uncultured Rhodospira sp.]|uniref:oligosaccharide flippase family protein n=1 Tax=uncultured Rhodospira sp. TaxID=1936189 RepID=UPI002621CCAA|nr:oligosaccharide flippase family protein [uncultured Rhodospira sp.]
MLKGALVLTGGRLTAGLVRIARNILLARLIGVEDYGVAGTFVITFTLVLMMADMAFDRFAIQHRSGDTPRFISVLHTLTLARAVLIAGLVYVSADLLARLYSQPELTWAYQTIAVVPVLLAFLHLDITREQRDMRFYKHAIVEIVGAAAPTVLLWPLALWLGDFRVILWLIAIECMARVAVSHWLADRPYRLGWEFDIAKSAFVFGIPLIFSSLLGFISMNGDRILVANQFTAHDLGLFTATLTLFLVPIQFAMSVVNSLFLPMLARERDNPRRFEQQASVVLQAMTLAGAGVTAGIAMVGVPLLLLTFGSDYAEASSLILPIGLMVGLFLARTGPNVIALSRGRTKLILVGSIVRVLALPVAVGVALAGGDIRDIVLVGAVGEGGALAVMLGLLSRRLSLQARLKDCRMVLVFGLGLLLILLLADRTALPSDVGKATAVALLLAMVAVSHALRRWVIGGLARRLRG